MRKLIHFLCFALLTYTAVAQSGKNPYNLPLINTLEAFNKETDADANNKIIDLQLFIPHLALNIRYADSPDYSNLTAEVINNRNLLIEIMDRHGFDVYESEWWHYDFRGWEKFSLVDLTFEQLMPDKLNH